MSDVASALTALITSQVRTTPTGITSDELLVDPSSTHGRQGNNDDFVLKDNGDNFRLFRSRDDLTFIYGSNDTASYWGGGNQTIYDSGSGTTLRFSELDQAQVKVYDFQNDPTGSVVVYNPTVTTLAPDGHGGTMFGSIDFINDPNVTMSQISFVQTATPPSQGGLVPVS
jgi:hypothetical protein